MLAVPAISSIIQPPEHVPAGLVYLIIKTNTTQTLGTHGHHINKTTFLHIYAELSSLLHLCQANQAARCHIWPTRATCIPTHTQFQVDWYVQQDANDYCSIKQSCLGSFVLTNWRKAGGETVEVWCLQILKCCFLVGVYETRSNQGCGEVTVCTAVQLCIAAPTSACIAWQPTAWQSAVLWVS